MKTRNTIMALALVAACCFSGCGNGASTDTPVNISVENNGFQFYALEETISSLDETTKYAFEADTSASDDLSVYLAYQKATNLSIDSDSMATAPANAEQTYENILTYRTDISHLEVVEVTDSAEESLQTAITDNPGKLISIKSDRMTIDKPLKLASDTYIVGNGCHMIAQGDVDAVFLAEGMSNIYISDLAISGEADYGCYFTDVTVAEITNCNISDLNEKPICILGESTDVIIAGNCCEANQEGGIYLSGDVAEVLICDNTLSENYGWSNWMAGITLARGTEDYTDIWSSFDDSHFYNIEDCDIMSAPGYPHDIVIWNNEITANQSGGIYLDGAYSISIIGNTVTSNDKEGTCLDYGTVGCFVYQNTYVSNGYREYQTDEVLKKDEVSKYGKMDDGSSNAKLPGISLDNAAFNVIAENTVKENAGSGIKMVRASVCNLITENDLEYNNAGMNDTHHFYGIELSGESEFVSLMMDYGPDTENTITENTIVGGHYAGIFLAESAYDNVIKDNTISGAKYEAIENKSTGSNWLENN